MEMSSAMLRPLDEGGGKLASMKILKAGTSSLRANDSSAAVAWL